MHNLPPSRCCRSTLHVVTTRNVRLCTLCLLCGDCSETERHVLECRVQSHIWKPAWQRLRAWLHVGPRVALVRRRMWDSTILEQWVAAIATPNLCKAHMGIVRLHDEGTGFIRSLNESLKV